MNFACLASGSKANSYIVASETTRVLVDCGLSLRELKRRLEVHSFSLGSIDAVIVTHEHDDHISGVKKLCLTHGIPLYLTEAVYQRDLRLQEISLHQVFFISVNSSFEIRDLHFESFNVPHDAVQTIALRIWDSDRSLCILTDIGEYDEKILQRVVGADALIIEANHDQEKLWTCPYPWYIKKRISGPKGHLGNHRTTEFIKELCKNKEFKNKSLKYIGAAHISENSNTHELALKALNDGIKDADFSPHLFTAKQHEVSDLFVL